MNIEILLGSAIITTFIVAAIIHHKRGGVRAELMKEHPNDNIDKALADIKESKL